MKLTSTRSVAIILVLWNIFLIWLNGPIKKHVLQTTQQDLLVFNTLST